MKVGWERNKLGRVCELIARGIAPKYVEEGGILVLNQKCVRDHRVSAQLGRRHNDSQRAVRGDRILRFGDVLVNSTGTGTLGRVAQIRAELLQRTTVDTHVTIVRPLAGKFHLDFFGYMMVQIEDLLATSGEGASGQTELSRSTLADKFDVSYPTSLEEQRRIVAVLDKAFAGIATATANAQKNLTNARALFERGLSDSFQNDGAAVALGSVAKFVRGPFGGSLKKSIFQPSGFAVYEQQHAIYDQFSEVRYFVGKEKFDEMARFQIRAGDILMSCSGTIGRVALIPDGAAPGIINQALLKFSPSSMVIGDYLLWYMRSQMFREQIAARSGGAALQNVASVAVLKEIKFPLPGSSDQLKIVSHIKNLKASTDTLAGVMSSKLAALAELKRSLLQKAFAGELT